MGIFGAEAVGPSPEFEGREPVWGGFFRRGGAFLIDLVVLFLFSLLLFYLLWVGYRVGLSAGQRVLSLDQVKLFFRLFFFLCVLFLAGYFFLLHHMGGQTVGKWVMGLRVVGAEGSAITYGQSAMRLIGYLISALWGLGFLWILWSREKRGWHDFLAGTWVLRR